MKIYFGVPNDKWKHCIVSGLLVCVLYSIFKDMVWACWVTFLIGLGKEIYDETKLTGGADFWDVVANVVGIAGASTTITLVEMLL